MGLELGQAFARLGADLTVLDVAERIAPYEEPEVSAALADALGAAGMRIVTDAVIRQVSRSADGAITLAGAVADRGDSLRVDALLIATGRTPNSTDLNLAAAGVDIDEGGFIVADEYLHTSSPRLWAAGDVTSSPQYVYVAAAQGALAADTPARTNYSTAGSSRE